MEVSGCHDCHTPMDKGKRIESKDLAGGMKFALEKGTFYTANITSDKATGIGAWSDDDILRVLNEGLDKSGRPPTAISWTDYKG